MNQIEGILSVTPEDVTAIPSTDYLHKTAVNYAAKCIKLEDTIARIKLICDYALNYDVDLTHALEEISKILEEGKKV